MPTKILFNRKLDARPDRIDFRDRSYLPPLRSLPDQYPDDSTIKKFFPRYEKDAMVLDQGQEGACTGFGLAAVINYLRWERVISAGAKAGLGKISPRMLYQNARLYDEWKGEDYDGSSCRGAMKGLHKHGVCDEKLWPYLEEDGKTPGWARPGWDLNAPLTPLGAYYRVDARSLVDLQAAINEVHAIYVASDVHSGWDLGTAESLDMAIIGRRPSRGQLGGHAFAIVGYRPDGFIVQNSWGPDWGYHGFGVLSYDDWTQYGQDAWVIALGAPMAAVRSPPSRTEIELQARPAIQATMAVSAKAASSDAIEPWIEGEESRNTIFIGHGGRPERELVEANDAADAVRVVVEDGVHRAMAKGISKIAIYAHGGLNNRDTGLKRARILGPWLAANGIHPIFVVWQTGFLESASDIIQIQLGKMGPDAAARPVEGWILDQLQEMKDRGFESVARNAGVKALWENMKSRARDASGAKGAMAMVAAHLAAATEAMAAKDRPEIHLIGHSAGAIMHGHFLGALQARGRSAASLHLWAPACTVSFANETFGKAFADKVVDPKATYVGVLSDKNEASDPCVPVAYSKSLLYLVSRGLEPDHKTPILGMQRVWKEWRPKKAEDIFNVDRLSDFKTWDAVSAGVVVDPPIDVPAVPTVREGKDAVTIKANHGSFDNNLDVVNTAIKRILGLKAPKVVVTDLRGF